MHSDSPAQEPQPRWNLGEDDTYQILKLIEANAVCGVIAPTGTGKSTTLMESIYKTQARIFVVELTIPAVENLYRYMGDRLGRENVGWAAEGHVNYTEKSNLVYCTAGHMRRKMLRQFSEGVVISDKIDFCDILVIDEAHAGGLDADVIMELWKTAIQSGARVPRLVLASATLNMANSQFPHAPYFHVKTIGFPVDIQWHDRDFSPEDPDLYLDVAKLVLDKHQSTPLNPEDPAAIWLVFCAGSNEVEIVCETLNESRKPGLSALPIYSNMPSEETSKIFQKPKSGERRVIVATNIAEASITVDGLSGIFDTLTEKYSETSASGGFRLVLSNISKSSAQQRTGRTGRTCPGFCYRMCTSKFFETLPEQRPLEISRVPLHSMIIELLSVGLAPQIMFVQRIAPSQLDAAIKTLKNVGMIDSDNRVTPMGYFAPKFPLSIRSAAILWYWIQSHKPLFPGIVAVSLIDCYGPSYFWYPRKTIDITQDNYNILIQNHYQKYFSKYNSQSDLEVLLKMWNDMFTHLGSIDPKSRAVSRWTNDHSLNNRKILECINITRQICNTLLRQDYKFEYGIFTPEGCLAILSPILCKVYSDQLYIRSGGTRAPYVNSVSNQYYRLDSKINLRHSTSDPPSQILGLITAEIQSKQGGLPTKLISLYHPYDPNWSFDLILHGPVKTTLAQPSRKNVRLPEVPSHIGKGFEGSSSTKVIRGVGAPEAHRPRLSRSESGSAPLDKPLSKGEIISTAIPTHSPGDSSINEDIEVHHVSPRDPPKPIVRSLKFQVPRFTLSVNALPSEKKLSIQTPVEKTHILQPLSSRETDINQISMSSSSSITLSSPMSTGAATLYSSPIITSPSKPIISLHPRVSRQSMISPLSNPLISSPKEVSHSSMISSSETTISSPPRVSPPSMISSPLNSIISSPPRIRLSSSHNR
jgi:hypothetical protein